MYKHILTTSELYLTEEAHHFHCFYMPSRYLGCVPGRNYKKKMNSSKSTGKYFQPYHHASQ